MDILTPKCLQQKMDSLGKRLRSLRKIKDLTQGELERMTGLSQSVISALENDQYPFEKLGTGHLMSLCKALGTNPLFLITGQAEHMNPDPQVLRLLDLAHGLNSKQIEALITIASTMRP